MTARPLTAAFLLLISSISSANSDSEKLYEQLLGESFMQPEFAGQRTDTGLDFNTADTIVLAQVGEQPRIHINLEGPFPVAEGNGLDEVLSWTVDTLLASGELNPSYQSEYPIAEGIGAVKVDINGTKVGFLDYQLQWASNAAVQRALLLVEGRLYGFTMVEFDATAELGQGRRFMALVIAAVNSGKL